MYLLINLNNKPVSIATKLKPALTYRRGESKKQRKRKKWGTLHYNGGNAPDVYCSPFFPGSFQQYLGNNANNISLLVYNSYHKHHAIITIRKLAPQSSSSFTLHFPRFVALHSYRSCRLHQKTEPTHFDSYPLHWIPPRILPLSLGARTAAMGSSLSDTRNHPTA